MMLDFKHERPEGELFTGYAFAKKGGKLEIEILIPGKNSSLKKKKYSIGVNFSSRR